MSYPLVTKTKGGKPIEATPETTALAASFERIAFGYYYDKCMRGDYPPEVVTALAACAPYVLGDYAEVEESIGACRIARDNELAYDAASVLACFCW